MGLWALSKWPAGQKIGKLPRRGGCRSKSSTRRRFCRAGRQCHRPGAPRRIVARRKRPSHVPRRSHSEHPACRLGSNEQSRERFHLTPGNELPDFARHILWRGRGGEMVEIFTIRPHQIDKRRMVHEIVARVVGRTLAKEYAIGLGH